MTCTVVHFPKRFKNPPPRLTATFDNLTAAIALDRLKSGTLEPAVLEALLAAVGIVRQ